MWNWHAGRIIFTLLTLAGLCGCARPRMPDAAEVRADALSVAAQAPKLRGTGDEAELVIPLVIENKTPEDVRILGFIPSCHCVRVEPVPVVVPAGGTAILEAIGPKEMDGEAVELISNSPIHAWIKVSLSADELTGRSIAGSTFH